MKQSHFFNLLALTLVLSLGVVSCKNPKPGITPIYGKKTTVGESGPNPPIDAQRPVTPDTNPFGTPLAGMEEFEGMLKDREAFKAFTAYFDYDRYAVKSGEKGKLEAVAKYFRSNREDKLLIEGHCDERGTEEYNRSLGERRAMALREYLIRLGVGADRIITRSYGEDQSADPGHNEAAWSKNRRGEFVLLKPKP